MKKQTRKRLNVRGAEKKRVAVLLTELEQATTQVLTNDHNLSGEQAEGLLEKIRATYQTIAPPKPAPLLKQRLGQVAQTYGLAAGRTLVEEKVLTTDKAANEFLAKLLEYAQRNRQPA